MPVLDVAPDADGARTGQWILAGTLLLFGFETMFASFLVGILDMRRESRRAG